jgi:hypothetical protein
VRIDGAALVPQSILLSQRGSTWAIRPDRTVYLDNRCIKGRAGYQVVSTAEDRRKLALRLDRARLGRCREQDRSRLPDVMTPQGKSNHGAATPPIRRCSSWRSKCGSVKLWGRTPETVDRLSQPVGAGPAADSIVSTGATSLPEGRVCIFRARDLGGCRKHSASSATAAYALAPVKFSSIAAAVILSITSLLYITLVVLNVFFFPTAIPRRL